MKAVVMAGGEGTRLRPMTASMPKPLLPIVNKPIMEHIIDLLHRAKDSDQPLPLLEKARETLKDFKPSQPQKMSAAHIGAHKADAVQAGAQEHKHKAMEAITEAIQTAKNGGDTKAKIESAIAHVHSAGDIKN